jgi:flavin-dependent dehydrogenase
MHDVIIAGGGPAGAIAAERAAKKGLSVLVLEKAEYPRDKTCGGGVSQKALDVIRGIDKGLIEREIFGAKIFLPDYQNFTGRAGSRVAVTTMRRKLDHWLINRAEDSGTRVRDNEPVKDIKFSKDHVEVATPKNRYQSRMIVGSDGVNSTVARKSGIRTRWGSEICLCLETEVELVCVWKPRSNSGVRLLRSVLKQRSSSSTFVDHGVTGGCFRSGTGFP